MRSGELRTSLDPILEVLGCRDDVTALSITEKVFGNLVGVKWVLPVEEHDFALATVVLETERYFALCGPLELFQIEVEDGSVG